MAITTNEDLVDRDIEYLWGHDENGVAGKMAVPALVKTSSADALVDGTTKVAMSATERTKLAGVAANATANQTDAHLLDRANHTGTQEQATITGLVATLADLMPKAQRGAANGVAPLDATSKIPSSFLPGFVDTMEEYANFAAFPATGVAGTIYVALDTGATYRWSGSIYVALVSSPGSSDAVPEGSVNLYFADVRVRASQLLGFSAGPDAVITADDTVITGIQKAQGQINRLTAKDAEHNIDIANRLRFDAVQTLSAGQKTQVQANAGLVIGTNVLGYTASLGAFATLPATADRLPYMNGTNTWANTTLTGFARSLLDDPDASTVLSTLGFSAFVKGLVGGVDAAALRSSLGLVIGTHVQGADAGLNSIAAQTTVANQILYTTAADTYATTSLTTFARTVLDDGDAATMRGTIGANNAANLTTGTLPNDRMVGGYSFDTLELAGAQAVNAASYQRYGIYVGRNVGTVGDPDAQAIGYFGTYSSGTVAIERKTTAGGAATSAIGLINDTSTGFVHTHGGNAYTVWTAGNHGSGSGMHADILDGYHAADLYRDNAHFSTTGNLVITNTAPKVDLVDSTSGAYSGRMVVDANNWYLQRSTDATTWTTVFYIEMDTNLAYLNGKNIRDADWLGGVGPNGYAKIYTGSTAANLDYPIGTLISVYTNNSSTSHDINSTIIPCIGSANNYAFRKQGTSGAGSALAGTWRSRGIIGDDYILAQRTA